jgi:hypothetical protein
MVASDWTTLEADVEWDFQRSAEADARPHHRHGQRRHGHAAKAGALLG